MNSGERARVAAATKAATFTAFAKISFLQNKTRKITADKLEFSKKFSQLINYTKTYSSRPQFVINSPPPWRFPPAPKSQSKHSQKIPKDLIQIHSHTISTFAASAPSSGLGDSGCPAFDDSGSSAAAAGF